MADPVSASVHIQAPPEQVFAFFVDPAKLVRWLGDCATAEARVDGRFEVSIRERSARGRYVEIDPPHRVVFTWGFAGSDVLPPGTSTVDVRLTPDAGGTRVELEHRDLPTQEEADNHRAGWRHFTGRLVIAATGGDPGPDVARPQ